MRIVEAAPLLYGASDSHSLAHLCGRHAIGLLTQLPIGHGGHLNVEIDAIQQRPADLAEILRDLPGRASALARRVAEMAAAARIKGADQD